MTVQGPLEELHPPVRAAFEALGTRVRIPRKTSIFLEGDPSDSIYVVEEGLIRVERVLPSGRTVLVNLVGRGGILGELGVLEDKPRSASASTVDSVRALVVPADHFVAALQTGSELHLAFTRWLSRRLREVTEQFLQATSNDAQARICSRLQHLLSNVDERAEPPIEVPFPITQAELAQWAGLSREATVRALRDLKAQGILEARRGRLLVNDIGAVFERGA
ncbi:MAG: Crp/Fnr family transcriptional regulator [Actinomycetia bacterium]|nr:Crp/Fnr family transcriptional regulator [Actinomycetes bacterium]